MAVLRLFPAYKDYLWGGEKLGAFYGKENAPSPLAETWELALHPEGLSRISDGRTADQVLTPAVLGENAASFRDFPLLIKLIDAAKDLSVQVHPSDEYALMHENSYGKTEMWYIVEAEAGAGIYLGFQREVTEKEAKDAIHNGSFAELLQFVPVKAGECYFIPAGTVHAIGAGCLIAEIQQNSNLTYRIYDYNRRGSDGKPRPLHIEQAFSVMSLSPDVGYGTLLPVEGETTLGLSRYFHSASISVSGTHTLAADLASFRAVTCVCGKGTIDGKAISRGDTYFIPCGESAMISGEMTLLSVSVRKYTLRESSTAWELYDDLGRLHCRSVAKDISAEEFLSKYALSPCDVSHE